MPSRDKEDKLGTATNGFILIVELVYLELFKNIVWSGFP